MPEGEVMIAVLGLMLGAVRSGEGDGDSLSKGLLRHLALLGAVVDMLRVSLCEVSRPDSEISLKHDATTLFKR